MELILLHGIVELVFFLAKVDGLGPVTVGAATINPAIKIFGFENEDSLFAKGETVNLSETDVG